MTYMVNREDLDKMISCGKKEYKKNTGCIARKCSVFPVFFMLLMVLLLFSSCGMDTLKDSSSVKSPVKENLTIYFLDVGQADSTLLVSQDEAMLVDAGNRDDAEFITGYLDDLGISRLKYIVFTHPHEDHIGSGGDIIDSIAVDKIFMLEGYDDGIEGYLKTVIDRMGIQTQAPLPGDTISLGECSIKFLGPLEKSDDENDNSICLKVMHGENSIIFTGDAGSSCERNMIESGEALEADILQAGHHGSSTSSSYYFLREVNPKYVVISCGKDNMYGHPHEESMSRFGDLGAEIFRTDEQGTVIAVSDGEDITFNCEGKKSERSHVKEYENAKYIGNINSRKYHFPDCGGLPNEENRIYFMDIQTAQEAGYEPCGRCHPDRMN